MAAVLAAVPAVAPAQDLRFEAVYNGKVPGGHREIPVEVGDVVEFSVEGSDRTVGRRGTITVQSFYDRSRKDGCKTIQESHEYTRSRYPETEASLFVHYFPAVTAPGEPQAIPLQTRSGSYVVKQAGILTLTDLVLPSDQVIFLDGPARTTLNEKEQKVLDDERASRANAGHHDVKTLESYAEHGSVALRVIVKVSRVR
jgi:hypothetical protein